MLRIFILLPMCTLKIILSYAGKYVKIRLQAAKNPEDNIMLYYVTDCFY